MKVKICGLRTEEAVLAAENAGADFLGFIFYEKSHRHVLPEEVCGLTKHVQRAKTVGVFVDAPLDEVNAAADFCSLDFVQLHGHESAAYARAVCRPVIKAFRWGDDFSAEEANDYPAEIILLDSASVGARLRKKRRVSKSPCWSRAVLRAAMCGRQKRFSAPTASMFRAVLKSRSGNPSRRYENLWQLCRNGGFRNERYFSGNRGKEA